MKEQTSLLELHGISKQFGSMMANDSIDLTLNAGEVLALLGENGAGKSTLMNIIYGIYHPDKGQIKLRGKEVRIHSPKEAMQLGVGMVHQHFMLIGRFTAVENVALISPSGSLSMANLKKVRASLEELKKKYEIEVNLDYPVEQLSISMQQKIEILKVLYTGADILILDEPTAVLLPQECESLFSIIQHVIKQGKGVIFISHKLDEVLQISHRVNVLSHGKITGEVETKNADKSLIIRMMSGDDVPDMSGYVKKPADTVSCMECVDLEAKDDRGIQTLNGVNLTVHRGEIVGVAGVEGNGQNELAEVLAGIRKTTAGKISVAGVPLGGKTSEFIQKGVGYIPADRNLVGTVPDFPLFENWLLRKINYPKKNGLTDIKSTQLQAANAMLDFDVRTSGYMERSANLSGGNLQKFILARELRNNPRALICSYPTRGLDVKASWFVRDKIVKAKENGTGVVLFSGDLEELFAISDRIVVMYRGKIVGERKPEETTPQEIIMMMMRGRV